MSVDVRAQLVDLMRRDLFGPHPQLDPDLEGEVLEDKPSRFYVGGFIVPAYDGGASPTDEDEEAEKVADELLATETLDSPTEPEADEQETPDQPPKDRFLPSSIGLTVMLPEATQEIELLATWGDYRVEPPLPDILVLPEAAAGGEKKPDRPQGIRWVRSLGKAVLKLDVSRNASGIPLSGSAAPQRPGGGLQAMLHQRIVEQVTPEGRIERLRIVTVFLVNRRKRARAPFGDLAYAFQAYLELSCPTGFLPRQDFSTYHSNDPDLRLADLHYRDLCEYAVGRNTSGDWEQRTDGNGRRLPVTRVWTDPMPRQEVEKVAPCKIGGVEFRTEDLARVARQGAPELGSALDDLPRQYANWRRDQEQQLSGGLAPRRLETARILLANIDAARARIETGISLLKSDPMAREAFAIMNEAIAMAARQRDGAIRKVKPQDLEKPAWRPFQLAFILLNLVGLTQKESPERATVDLLFFPTGGGKTEAYLGLAAYAIALRRLRGSGVLGAGVSVIMRYTLRLLTLDQLSRASGLVCALELIRTRDAEGRKRLGDWPIEIGLWVGGAASPNRMKPRPNRNDDNAATTWLGRYIRNPKRAKSPVPLKACPWCFTPFKPESFRIAPNRTLANNLAIKCENPDCHFTRDRDLPILVVDEPIYRRLPAFLIATVDKFAALPWVGSSGAFFGHVDRVDPERGFFAAAEPKQGRRLDNGHRLDPPDLIIQDELHLISGPLGTVAGLYEMAIDLLTSRKRGEHCIRPKIVASTATVRRAQGQICRLFGRSDTAVFPPAGIDRKHSFFAETLPASREPARLYVGVASQGRGPKLLFLRVLQTLLSGAQALSVPPVPSADDPADPYLTVLCYFNALRELGAARRLVEDEIREHVAGYGSGRWRHDPPGRPFADRVLRQPVELTSREPTDDVAMAKERLGVALRDAAGATRDEAIDVALATNMISVGLDISRLGLMMVQGQPKTTAEYIQATSRVGRETSKPGLVVTVLNLHKPRDRTHYEQFRAFHASFYRAVEATSVTPFAPRALDRALPAVIVAAARHAEPDLTPSAAVIRLKDHPSLRQELLTMVRERAAAAGADPAIAQRAVDRTGELLDAWETVVARQTSAGSAFDYDDGGPQRRLLQHPLDPGASTLDPEHQQFVAARSMRDVEYGAYLRVLDPRGNTIQGASDAQ
jgi:hypothetical protein